MNKKNYALSIILAFMLFGCKDKKDEIFVYENGAYMGENSLYGIENFRRNWYIDYLIRKCLDKDSKKIWGQCSEEVYKLNPNELSDEFILNEWHKVHNPELAK